MASKVIFQSSSSSKRGCYVERIIVQKENKVISILILFEKRMLLREIAAEFGRHINISILILFEKRMLPWPENWPVGDPLISILILFEKRMLRPIRTRIQA